MVDKCMIIGGVCPETNKPTGRSKGRFCPHWVSGLPQCSETDGQWTDSTYTGCFLLNLPRYLVHITANASHAAASYDAARNTIAKTPNAMIQAILTMGLSAVAGSKQLEVNNEKTNSDNGT